MAGPFDGHRPGEHLEPALGGCVGPGSLAAHLAHKRADVDDFSPAAADHPGCDGASDVEGARQVDVDDLAPGFVGELLQRTAPVAPYVVHQHVHSAHLGFDLRDGERDLLRIGDVEGPSVRVESFAFQFGDDGVEFRFVAAVKNHSSPGSCEPSAHRQAQPLAGTRYQRRTPAQVEQ